jgi:hypothetical protein
MLTPKLHILSGLHLVCKVNNWPALEMVKLVDCTFREDNTA